MLQKIDLVAYKKALELAFDQLCRVTERQKFIKSNGSVGFEDVEVFSGVPCKVSYKTSTVTGSDGLLSSAEQLIKLFISSDIEIKPSSRIFIKSKTSDTEKEYSRSSEPKVYGSHQEIELKLVKM